VSLLLRELIYSKIDHIFTCKQVVVKSRLRFDTIYVVLICLSLNLYYKTDRSDDVPKWCMKEADNLSFAA
jgi:hypothetical protein